LKPWLLLLLLLLLLLPALTASGAVAAERVLHASQPLPHCCC
jgi:hypothetical protein